MKKFLEIFKNQIRSKEQASYVGLIIIHKIKFQNYEINLPLQWIYIVMDNAVFHYFCGCANHNNRKCF